MQRLLDAAAYSRVFAKARRSRDSSFTVLYRKNGGTEARLGLAISKKNCRGAVARNRLKRIIRESFRLNQDRLAGLDIVVMNKKGTEQQPNAALFASLEHHWRQCQRSRKQSGQDV